MAGRRDARDPQGTRRFRLDFLGEGALAEALAWLEKLPGVGRKVAASTLNASILRRPVFIVDSHVLRILQRLRFVDPHAVAAQTSDAVTAARPGWSGDDFLAFHMMVKRLGQTICHATAPECGICPLRNECPSAGRVHTKARYDRRDDGNL